MFPDLRYPTERCILFFQNWSFFFWKKYSLFFSCSISFFFYSFFVSVSLGYFVEFIEPKIKIFDLWTSFFLGFFMLSPFWTLFFLVCREGSCFFLFLGFHFVFLETANCSTRNIAGGGPIGVRRFPPTFQAWHHRLFPPFLGRTQEKQSGNWIWNYDLLLYDLSPFGFCFLLWFFDVFP